MKGVWWDKHEAVVRALTCGCARLPLDLGSHPFAQGHERNLHAVPGRHGQIHVAVPRSLRAAQPETLKMTS